MKLSFKPGERATLVAQLGLNESATDEEISAAVAERLTGTPSPAPTPSPTPAPLASATGRDGVIGAAVADGRIPPSRADHWRSRWDRDPDGTRKLVAKLHAVPDSLSAEESLPEGYPPEWLPEVGGQQRPRVTMAD